MRVPLTASSTDPAGASSTDVFTMRVPEVPARMAEIWSGAPITPTAPGAPATKSATAATLGSMLPSPNSPASM